MNDKQLSTYKWNNHFHICSNKNVQINLKIKVVLFLCFLQKKMRFPYSYESLLNSCQPDREEHKIVHCHS